MTPTQDSCLVLLLSTSNGLALHKVTSSGDSLWTQFHNRPTTGAATRFEECTDRGFVIVGQFNGTVSYGYILKTDSRKIIAGRNSGYFWTNGILFWRHPILTATIGYDYLWSTGDTTQSILVTTGGNYFVTVTDSIGLQAISDSISILVHTPVQPTISRISDTLYSSIASNYQWYLNDTLISGATNQSYTALANGLYTVETTDSNGCHSFSAVYDLTTVGLQNISLKSIDASFIPNPTSNQGSLVLHGIHSDKLEVSLFNQMGQKIETLFKGNFRANETNILFDFSMYNSGVYVIRVNSGELSTNLRVLVLK
ncbi:MAG: T9SS type A sorting domain-containing protein [Bacteroidetes bacterium]|nr:T9SS type A sorting domain-containing protein [Bacteroidota bacterium]